MQTTYSNRHLFFAALFLGALAALLLAGCASRGSLATDSADLTPRADNKIRRLSDFMKQYPERNVLIEGHTDNTGSQRQNLGLSQQRADSVGTKIAAHGISTRHITTRGLGQRLPVASNTTAEDRQHNRRVDVTILNEGVNPMAQR